MEDHIFKKINSHRFVSRQLQSGNFQLCLCNLVLVAELSALYPLKCQGLVGVQLAQVLWEAHLWSDVAIFYVRSK